MFRISQYMQLIAALERGEAPPRARGGAPAGPVVIWNLIRRCNLTCRHCYSISADTDFPNELSTEQVFRTMDDLHAAGVRVLILSGGEPLLRPDIWQIADRAKAMGFYVGLSTNGTLIDAALAERVAAQGFDYVGISLDGIGATHDHFRRKEGAFDASLAAIRQLHALGVKVGARYTMTEGNAHDFEPLLDLCEREGIDKFYFSHLNYAGRGNKNRKTDAQHATTRRAMVTLFARALTDALAGGTREYVTGNNDADGVFLLQWVHRHFPQHQAIVAERLVRWGGNSSGMNVANIDNLGVVHPDTMWWHYPLGNVKARPFGEIWADTSDPLMAGLKQRPRPVTGRCGACAYLTICNGNTRTRAQQLTGDFWAEDPGCYLSDEEIGVEHAPAPRVSIPLVEAR
ncbi:heme d1 biosynthesis radical SAM protein NirJ [Niveibacterium sp.]|uniref:heme d1 biosynthesis radical SAM protein NirJ n=1 Tax=Niveibacterium sp. TaxID=2017444 RepID=UPI0035B1625B